MSRTFQLIAGHPVLDFVNTLDDRFRDAGPIELVATHADLLGFARQSGLASARQWAALQATSHAPAAAKALRSARELREALAMWFYTADAGNPARLAAVKTLERHFLDADRHRELAELRDPQPRDAVPRESSNSPRVAWTWGRFENHPRLPVWLIARAAAGLLVSQDTDRIHQCESATCRWLFFDMSRNRSRRWCDMKLCGNRMKARRFQRRLTAAPSAGGLRAPSTN
jgi:predicted RNA-binding Zn ribbon-like protein